MNMMMNEQKAAAYLGLSLRTLQRMRKNKSGPSHHKFGRRIGYIYQDLDAFMQEHRYGAEYNTMPADQIDFQKNILSNMENA